VRTKVDATGAAADISETVVAQLEEELQTKRITLAFEVSAAILPPAQASVKERSSSSHPAPLFVLKTDLRTAVLSLPLNPEGLLEGELPSGRSFSI
jgi:hypothetical protein